MSRIDYRREGTRALESLGNLLQRLNPWVFSTFLVVVMLLKDGVGFYYVFNPSSVSSGFPLPLEGPNASSFGWPLIVWLLQIETYRGLWLLPLVVILVTALVLTPLLCRRVHRPTAYAISTVVLLGPIPMSLLSHLGRHDFLVVIGGVALVLSLNRPMLAALAALTMSSGNPEQAMVATFLLLAVVLLTRQGNLRTASFAAVLTSGVYWLAVSALLSATGRSSRIETLTTVIPDASLIALSNLPVLIWATYGLSSFALLAMLLATPSWRRLILIAVVASPVALYFLGDQTRIGVTTASPLIVLATILVVDSVFTGADLKTRKVLLGAITLTATVLPTVHVLYVGGHFEPYTFIVEALF